MQAKIRLYVEQDLAGGQPVALTREQAHYLFGVMRLGPGDRVALFNGRDGEWQAEVADAGRKAGTLMCRARSAPLVLPPDLWLLFAPIKKARTDFIVEKAVEMGVRRIVPVQTEHTNSERLRQDRAQAHAVEAAEQCGAGFVPEVAALARLDRVLAGWPAERRLMFCDETAAGSSVRLDGLATRTPQPDEAGRQAGSSGAWAILIGPEGGFSADERNRLAAMPQSVTVSLGPRILRADTAAVAALTLWQMQLGDWV